MIISSMSHTKAGLNYDRANSIPFTSYQVHGT